jgi:hypothetical protein
MTESYRDHGGSLRHDASVADLIDRSSIGDAGARQLLERVPADQVAEVLRRAELHDPQRDRDYVSTADFALAEVHTFDDLLPHLHRLYVRAGMPSYREIERRTRATEGIDQLGRNRTTRILANGELRRDELTSFLFAHRVRQDDYQSWYDAHWRAAEHRWAANILSVRERCLIELRRLIRDLDRMHATLATGGDDAARLVRTLDSAASRLRETIDEVLAEVMVLTSAAGLTAAGDQAQPSGNVGEVTSESDSAAEAVTATLTWAANVMDIVPLPVFAAWLRLQPPTVFNVVARERPQLMASLLATIPVPNESVAWLLTWEPESAAEALAAASPGESERYLEAMAPKDAAALLARMNPLVAARTLTKIRREVATGHLMAIGAAAGTPILERLDREICVGVLLRMHDQDKALAEEFLHGMDVQAASACLERMDEQMADKRRARDLLQRVSERRRRKQLIASAT